MAFKIACLHNVMNMTVGTFAEAAPSSPDNFGLGPVSGMGWEQSTDHGFAAAAALIAAVAFAIGILVGLLVA